MKSKEMFSNYCATDDGIILDKDNKPIKTFKSNNHWQCCIFDNNGKRYTMGVHSVVAMLNIDDWYDGCIVHHKDGDYHNNAVSNLEIMSRNQHALQHHDKGELHNLGKYAHDNFIGKGNPIAKKVYCIELNLEILIIIVLCLYSFPLNVLITLTSIKSLIDFFKL